MVAIPSRIPSWKVLVVVALLSLKSMALAVHAERIPAGVTFRSDAAECRMESSDIATLYFDQATGSWEKPHPAFLPFLQPAIQMKECWCARLFGRSGDFCPEEFDACHVPGPSGPVSCYSYSVKVNTARGAWPFALFLATTTVYLLVASERGRRARGYVRRQFGNLKSYIKEPSGSRDHGIEEHIIEEDANAPMDSAAPTSTPIQEESLENTVPVSNEDEETGIPPSTQPDESSQSGAENTEIGPIETSLSLGYSTEMFGSRSNYDQLVSQLYEMRSTQPDRIFHLWYSAWLQERRILRTRARRDRIRRYFRSLRSETATEADARGEEGQCPWWEMRRTIHMQLKTKRFQSDSSASLECLPVTIPTGCADDEVNHSASDVEQENACAICLCELKDGDVVGDISCNHLFHKDCLKDWLKRSNRCPLCQQDGIVTFQVLPFGAGSSGAATDTDSSSAASSSNTEGRRQG